MSNLLLPPLVNVPPNTLWLSPASRGIFFGDRRLTLASGSIGSAIGVKGPYTTAAMRTAGSGVNFVGQLDNRVFTLVIQCVPTAQAIAASNYIGFTRSSDGNGFIGLQTGTGTAAEFSFLSNTTRTNTGVAYEVGKPYNIVITGRRSGGTSVDLRVFINGTKVVDNPSGFANSAFTAADSLAIYANGANCQTYLAAAWAGSVNDAEGRSLSLSPLGVLRSRPRQLFVPVSAGGTTTVTSSSAASYKIQGSVQSSSVAAYGIRSAIQSDSAVSYAIRASAQNDAASSYTVRGSIQQSTTPTYLIRGLVDQTIAAIYGIRSAVSSDAAATYNILSATSVSTSASAGYNIRGSINQDVAASYPLRGAVTQDTSATYSILSASAVSSSVTAGYAIKGSVQSGIVAGYSIAQTVQAEIAASYNIRAGAVSEAQAAYVIRGLVQQSIAASYAVEGDAFSGSISDADIARIVQAVLSALNATTIPVNIKQVNSITIKGAGVTGNTWGPM